MKRYTLYYIISLATMFFVACNSSLDGIVQEQPAMIGFGVDVDDTRSTIIQSSEDATFRAKAFRVFAEHTPEGGVPQDVFNDVDVKYDGRLTGWNYDGEPKMWAENGTYVFRGYWPSTTKLASGTATTSSLVLEYSVKSDNDDLMVGYYACPTKNPDSYGNVQYVGFKFHHTLAAVRIALKIGQRAKAKYTVKNVYFTSLIYTNSLSYTQLNSDAVSLNSWGNAGVRSENDEFGVDRIREWKDGDEGVSGLVPVTTDDADPQYLYLPWQLMIPQSLLVTGSTPKPAVVIELETNLDGKIHSSIKSLTLPTATINSWEPSKKYTYTITLQPNSFDITVQSVKWDVVDGVVPDLEF